jgi:hypothetical protein
MSVQFKVAFTISGETLFAMISKMLPIEDLSVEEIAPTPAERPIAIAHKLKVHKRKGVVRLDMGINRIIMEAIDKQPTSVLDLRPKVKAGGYSPHSVSSRLEQLRRKGYVSPMGDGRWKRNAT